MERCDKLAVGQSACLLRERGGTRDGVRVWRVVPTLKNDNDALASRVQ